MKRLILLITAWSIFVSAGSLFAQGVQTGTIRGLVKDQQDLAVPGVTVTATSPALQGPRSAVTDREGLYVFRALPPGNYQLDFELAGFATLMRNVAVPLGSVIETNVSMRAAGVAESVQVTAEQPAADCDPGRRHERDTGGNREPRDAADDSGHRAALARRQRSLAEHRSAGCQRRLRLRQRLHDQRRRHQRQPVRDAAEPVHRGRDRGDAGADLGHLGRIRPVHRRRRSTRSPRAAATRSRAAGASISSNPSWTTETPFEKCADTSLVTCTAATEHLDVLSRTYEGTFGGPLLRDKLWFFTSGRYGSVNSSTTLMITGVVLPTNDTNKRGEIKLTGTARDNHTLQFGYLNDPRKRTNNSGLQSLIIDPHSEVDRENPNWYCVRKLPRRPQQQSAR